MFHNANCPKSSCCCWSFSIGNDHVDADHNGSDADDIDYYDADVIDDADDADADVIDDADDAELVGSIIISRSGHRGASEGPISGLKGVSKELLVLVISIIIVVIILIIITIILIQITFI